MTLSTTAPPAGWFPDPGDPAQERWWSGESWTEHHRQVEAAPTLTAVDSEEALQPEYVFGMTAQPVVEEPAVAAAAEPVAATTSAEQAAPATRPTLPTFEELLAAAAAPAPADFHGPEDIEPAAEVWKPKSYGAPAPEETVAPVEAPAVQVAPASEAAPVVEVAPVTEVAPAAPVAEVLPVPAVAAVPAPSPALAVAEPEVAPAFAEPAPAPLPAPAFAQPAPAPAFPQPAAAPAGFAMPTPLAEPGLVMPSAPILEATPARSEQTARHAEAVAEIVPPAPSAPPAPAPVGYTASADPAVANRYRMALHNPEPEAAEADPFGAPVMGPYPVVGLAPAGSAPNQPGWQGMPLPGAGAPAPAFAPGVPAPGVYTPPLPSQGGNKTAWTALGSGALALGLAIFFLFFDRIGLWPALLAIAAVIQGIIGAVHSRKVRAGLGAAILAMVLGVAALVIMVTTVISWTLDPEYMMDATSAETEVLANAADYGFDLTRVDCDDMSGTAGSEFHCTGYDASDNVYDVTMVVDSAGYYNWTIEG